MLNSIENLRISQWDPFKTMGHCNGSLAQPCKTKGHCLSPTVDNASIVKSTSQLSKVSTIFTLKHSAVRAVELCVERAIITSLDRQPVLVQCSHFA